MSDTRPYIRSEQRQSDTVEAVIRLCGERDPATLSTAAIADAINLSQGALFKHFPNKKTLWESVARWVAQQLTGRIAATADGHSSPLAGLRAMFLAHVDFIVRHPGAPRLMLGELQKPDQSAARTVIMNAMTSYRGRIGQLLETAMATGEVRADLDTDAAAVLYLGAIQGLAVQALVSGDMATAAQAAPRVLDIFLAGIREPQS